MRKLLTIAATTLLLAAGLGLASLSGPSTPVASAHIGAATFDCSTGVTFNFTSFANANGNTVNAWVKVNGVQTWTGPLVWNGSNSPAFHPVPSLAASNLTVRAGASWNTNGHSGSYDSGDITLACSKPCDPVTVTITTPGPTTTVHDTTIKTVTNTATVTNTETVPGPTVTVKEYKLDDGPVQIVTVTTPGPSTSSTHTVTRWKTKTVTKWKTRWRTHVVTKPCKPKPKTHAGLVCDSHGKRCGFAGKG